MPPALRQALRFADCRSSRLSHVDVSLPFARATEEANLAGSLGESHSILVSVPVGYSLLGV
jgi:hypothetical protein